MDSFKPKYIITNRLLENIKHINNLVNELNNRRFPNVILVELERSAGEVSSYASTSIEGNPLPLTEVKKILKSKPSNIRNSEREVLNYNQALENLNRKNKQGKTRLSVDLILKIQKQVTNGLLPKFESGRFRQKPVVVNDPRTGQTIYLPPEFSQVKSLTTSLVDFVNNNRGVIDPLILAGIFHKQMVIIHPFMDGNGRATRLATKVLLTEMGLDTFNLFSFENYYNQNVTNYFQTVGEYGNYYEIAEKIDFTLWLEYFTEGIIDELLRVQKMLPQTATSPESELKQHHLEVLKFIKNKGYVADRDYAKFSKRAKATRTIDFDKLIKLGFIERKGKGKATYYTLIENDT